MSKSSSTSSDATVEVGLPQGDSTTEQVTVTLAHGALRDGGYVAPGETVTVSADEAAALRASGYAVADSA